MAAQVVVITGASGGIGRATARLFAKRGAKVALLARGTVGLEAAAKDVEAAGGTALVIPTDVADYEQVEHAAARAEEVLGPIDVWINDAFTSVFAPYTQIEPRWPAGARDPPSRLQKCGAHQTVSRAASDRVWDVVDLTRLKGGGCGSSGSCTWGVLDMAS